jgi:addiction module HigA family antidote
MIERGIVMPQAAKRNPKRCPTHPGALLREDVIPATGRSKVEIAQLLGLSRQHLYDILRERKPVSPAIAVRLGKLFGDGAGVWVRMQAAHDTWHAERDVDVPTSRRCADGRRNDAAGPLSSQEQRAGFCVHCASRTSPPNPFGSPTSPGPGAKTRGFS